MSDHTASRLMFERSPASMDELLTRLSRGMPVVALAGMLMALFGTYWDEAWHTDIGRDSFWSPPHLVLYSGPALMGLAVVLWTWSAWRRGDRTDTPAYAGPALFGLAVTFASAPIDDMWHELFGRDSVAWSPAHMTGFLGILAIGTAVALRLADYEGRLHQVVRPMAAAGLVAGFAALVFEYDADVPQFAAIWYLPVLATGTALAFAWSTRIFLRDPFIASKAALTYTVFMLIVILFLRALGHSHSLVPMLFVAAPLFDLAVGRGLPRPLVAAAYALALHLAYVPYLFLLDGVRLGLVEIAMGLPLSIVGVWAALAVAGLRAPRLQTAGVAVAATVVATLAISGQTLAHDPGQGRAVVPVELQAQVRGGVVGLTAYVSAPACGELQPTRVVARRAGQEVVGSFGGGPCTFRGSLRLPEVGRWFVYAEWQSAGGRIEAWIPVLRGDHLKTLTFEKSTEAYQPPYVSDSSISRAAAVGLYVLSGLGFLYLARLVRRRAERPRSALRLRKEHDAWLA